MVKKSEKRFTFAKSIKGRKRNVLCKVEHGPVKIRKIKKHCREQSGPLKDLTVAMALMQAVFVSLSPA